jgi:hypothetical protein
VKITVTYTVPPPSLVLPSTGKAAPVLLESHKSKSEPVDPFRVKPCTCSRQSVSVIHVCER